MQGSGAQAQAESIVAFLSNEGHVKQLKQDKAYNLAFLQEVFQIGPPQIDALFHYAKFQFDCGNYSVAAEFLYHYRRAGTAWQEGCPHSQRGFADRLALLEPRSPQHGCQNCCLLP